ncbi:MAG: LPS export ABC transporter periplasmic protein LptC [Bacteroidales bacterium]|nr:LPS export ABC transporter periplasmic protein LptC [Bacteroidales bacterium]MBN2757856.1 LPS export ABC transporter periplasmic protein LptC [Bacteroidales bacterium]
MILNKFIHKSIVILIFSVFTMLFSCSDDIPVVNRITSKEDLPTVSIENLNTSYTENGKIKGKLKTPLLNQFDDVEEPYLKFPKGVSIVMYDKNGKTESSMSANYAIYHTSKQLWEAHDNVVMTNIKGDILKTDKLYGNEKEKKIYTDEFVTIISADGTQIKGVNGFESNTEFTIYKFFDVSGKIFIHDDIEENSKNQSSNHIEEPIINK